jgi:hypothetical protein
VLADTEKWLWHEVGETGSARPLVASRDPLWMIMFAVR